MIQSNELRLGNWLIYGAEEQFEQISAGGIEYIVQQNEKGRIQQLFKPIPLTEEILLKCGFVKSPEHKNFYYLVLNDWTKIYVSFYAKEYAVELSVSKHGYCPNVQYLHQLQNLYFALTGKELSLNL